MRFSTSAAIAVSNFELKGRTRLMTRDREAEVYVPKPIIELLTKAVCNATDAVCEIENDDLRGATHMPVRTDDEENNTVKMSM